MGWKIVKLFDGVPITNVRIARVVSGAQDAARLSARALHPGAAHAGRPRGSPATA